MHPVMQALWIAWLALVVVAFVVIGSVVVGYFL
jgi:hypothetical protein